MASDADRDPRRRRRAWWHPPLWARWVLALIFFAAIGIGLVNVLRNDTSPSVQSDSGAVQANDQGRAVIEQDQSPHTAALPRASSPRLALERAIAGDIRSRVGEGQLTGPAGGVRCTRAGQPGPGRAAFRCTAVAGGLRYPFLGVDDVHARRLIWCKRDPSSDPALAVPVDSRCRT